MEDYFGGGGAPDGANGDATVPAAAVAENGQSVAPATDDIDMIE